MTHARGPDYAFGAAAYPVGVALGAAEMRWPRLARWVPAATGALAIARALRPA